VESVDAKADILQWIETNRCPVKKKKLPATATATATNKSAVPLSLQLLDEPLTSGSSGFGAESALMRAKQQLMALPWCGDVFSASHLSHVSQLPLPPGGDDLTTVPPSRALPVMSSQWVLTMCQLPLLRLERSEEEEEEVSRGECEGSGAGGQGEADLLSFDDDVDPQQKKKQQQQHPLADPFLDPLSLPATTTSINTNTTMGHTADEEDEDEEVVATGYETAEDVLESLLGMQADMRQFWTDIVDSFSDDPQPVAHDHEAGGADVDMEVTSPDCLEYAEEEEEEEEEEGEEGGHRSGEGGDEVATPDRGAVANDIIKSWGLLDAVSSDAEPLTPLALLPSGAIGPVADLSAGGGDLLSLSMPLSNGSGIFL
jgi:hypothetical protein